MGIKLLSNYPLKQFSGISIPNVELTFKGEFRQEKRDNKYTVSSIMFLYNNPEHNNSFEIIPFSVSLDACPDNPLTELYNSFKVQYLSGMDYQDN